MKYLYQPLTTTELVTRAQLIAVECRNKDVFGMEPATSQNSAAPACVPANTLPSYEQQLAVQRMRLSSTESCATGSDVGIQQIAAQLQLKQR